MRLTKADGVAAHQSRRVTCGARLAHLRRTAAQLSENAPRALRRKPCADDSRKLTKAAIGNGADVVARLGAVAARWF